MAIFISDSLASEPTTLPNNAPGQLKLALMATVSPSETAQIKYEITTPNVVFTGTNSATMTTTEEVFTTGTTVRRAYGLRGPAGAVKIRVEVGPGDPPSSSATVVALVGGVAPALTDMTPSANPLDMMVAMNPVAPPTPVKNEPIKPIKKARTKFEG
jgi:hypothetical protein